MAIKKRTQPIPSPSDIKQSPQSFSEQELNELKNLRTKINRLTLQFGQISINLFKLEKTKKELENQLLNLEKEESEIAKKLSAKYGDGSIDLESGTFTPSK
tara:strand:+ start:125 stop:427 length:303 start_codon:yes stop_codon:yes gene_type:complete